MRPRVVRVVEVDLGIVVESSGRFWRCENLQGPSTAQLANARAASLRMTEFGWVGDGHTGEALLIDRRIDCSS